MSGTPESRRSYPVSLLLHNIMRVLAADGCRVTVTGDGMDAAVKAGETLLTAFGIEAGDDE